MNDFTEVKVNCAILIRGDVIALKRIMQQLNQWISHEPELKLVHQQVSASKLWIKEGDDMNEWSRED